MFSGHMCLYFPLCTRQTKWNSGKCRVLIHLAGFLLREQILPAIRAHRNVRISSSPKVYAVLTGTILPQSRRVERDERGQLPGLIHLQSSLRQCLHWPCEHQPFAPHVSSLSYKLSAVHIYQPLLSIAVWSQPRWLILLLVVIILGHWSLLLHGTGHTFSPVLFDSSLTLSGILIKAAWIPGSGCAITNTSNKLLAITFIYSMCFDFFVLIMTGIKLAFPAVRQNQSRIVQLIFTDGLIFFIVA